MFRIEFLPAPADFQQPGNPPAQHSIGADPAGTLVAAAAAQDAQNAAGGAAAGGGALAFLLVLAGFVVAAMMGRDKPGEGASIGRESDGVQPPRRPQSTGGLAGEALDLDASEYDDLFMGNRRHFDAEGKRLFDMARENAGEAGFYALLEGSRLRHEQERQRVVNLHRREDAELFEDLVEESGLNGVKRRRPHRAGQGR